MREMTPWGVGPRWVALSLLFSVPAIGARLLWPRAFSLAFLPRPLVVAIALALLAAGIPLCVAGVIRLARGFPKGELFTRGAYGLCRHPIYASWIVFNVPGMVLLANSWVGLLVPVAMYVALRLLVREEEQWLERTFGDEYLAYRERVPAVFPLPRWWHRGSE
jgi:protein-S-isoprenylcysteine O-methyltransferase Ste14